jgi:hypothetical protein
MNRLLIAAIVIVFLALVSGGVFAWRILNPGIVQPIQFNHALHVDEMDMVCGDCHRYFEEGATSGFPGIEVCRDCHEEPLGESPEEAKLLQYITAGEEIPWKRLYVAEDNVYYSHRRHVVAAELLCESCHGDMAGATEPPGHPLKKIAMDNCIACHLESGADTDCLACHR